MAYINTSGKGLELFPQVSSFDCFKKSIQSDESEEENDDENNPMACQFGSDYENEYGDSQGKRKKKKKKRNKNNYYNDKKNEANDADIETLYTADPSKSIYLITLYRQT